jgi:hypothetical protein
MVIEISAQRTKNHENQVKPALFVLALYADNDERRVVY